MNRIPYLTLTLCQQGGIGFPPTIVKLDRWYAVSDSRNNRPSERIANLLRYQRRRRSAYDRKPDPHWHTQKWVLDKWHSAPRLTWDEVERRVFG